MLVGPKQESLLKSIWNLVKAPQGINWNGKPLKIWTILQGEQFDYSKATLRPLTLVPVKQEGMAILFDDTGWDGLVKLGDWWSVEFRFRRLVIRFRYRSWTRNIFYIAWD